MTPDCQLGKIPDPAASVVSTARAKAGMHSLTRSDYLAIGHRVCDADSIAVVWRSLLVQAQGGDLLAIGMILDRLLGKPRVAVDVQTVGPSVEDMRARLLAMLASEPAALRRTIESPQPIGNVPRGTPQSLPDAVVETETQSQIERPRPLD